MNDGASPAGQATPQTTASLALSTAEAERNLSAIQAKLDTARAELDALHHELAKVRLALALSREAGLVEANEHLLIAALQAIESADAFRLNPNAARGA